jgi:hypothetical protein
MGRGGGGGSGKCGGIGKGGGLGGGRGGAKGTLAWDLVLTWKLYCLGSPILLTNWWPVSIGATSYWGSLFTGGAGGMAS